jgi:hypothetical protein
MALAGILTPDHAMAPPESKFLHGHAIVAVVRRTRGRAVR